MIDFFQIRENLNQAVSFLMHPKSPINRLLVDHPTGSGKTREMIKARPGDVTVVSDGLSWENGFLKSCFKTKKFL